MEIFMKKHNRIWLYRLIPILFLIIYTVGLSEIFYQSQIRSTTEKCWDELSTVRDETAVEFASKLNNNLTLLDLASDAVILNSTPESGDGISSYLSEVKNKTVFDRIDIVLPSGTIWVHSLGEYSNSFGKEYYDAIIEGGFHFSKRMPDFLTGQESISAFSPIVNESGDTVAVLRATLYCKTLAEEFKSAHYGEEVQLFMIDRRDGSLVIDKWNETPGSIYDMQDYEIPEEYGDRNLISEIMSGKSGRLYYESNHYGNTSYTVYAPIEGTDFSIAMIIQEDTVMADLEEQKAAFTLFGIFEVILIVILAVWVFLMTRRSIEIENRAQTAELELLQKKEEELKLQYEEAVDRQEFLEIMAENLPGGYHRCSTDSGFILSFVSNSFLEITGYTKEQISDELDDCYINLVAPEDVDYFMSLEPQLKKTGRIDCTYRIRRRDGSLRWVQDSTQKVERDGQQYYQCTLADIHDFVNVLNEAKKAAEESSLAKSTFLFNASHDIRTPMNAIVGFARIIEQNADDTELVRRTVEKIENSSKTLMTLLNDVLELSRIERGKDELNIEAVDLSEHKENLYEMFAQSMRDAGITFNTEESICHRNVLCDSLKLTRIGMNFLSNARKFTPTGGTVTFGIEELSSNEKNAVYRFYCKDTGIGMSKEFQERAFSQFEREHTATESGVSGSGLGLSITKKFVELMGGKVEIRSELGEGTEIFAILSLALTDENTVKGKPNAFANSDMTGKRVLLVEDNDFNREIAKYVLEGMNFIVDEAENGSACVDILLKSDTPHYDLILMDLQMPVMDGYTATEEIRRMKNRNIAQIPIIAMTANAFEEDKQKCLSVGMNGHISKPIEIDVLERVLSDIFHK